MGLYYSPPCQQQVAGGQPLQNGKLPPALLVTPGSQPPIILPALTRAVQASIATSWIPPPPGPVQKTGLGLQPYGQPQLPGVLLHNTAKEPPYTIPALTRIVESLLSTCWIPAPPGPYQKIGQGRQPYGTPQLTGKLLHNQANEPPYMHPSQTAALLSIIATTWIPGPPLPQPLNLPKRYESGFTQPPPLSPWALVTILQAWQRDVATQPPRPGFIPQAGPPPVSLGAFFQILQAWQQDAGRPVFPRGFIPPPVASVPFTQAWLWQVLQAWVAYAEMLSVHSQHAQGVLQGGVILPPPIVLPPPLPPIPDVLRDNYDGKYLITANRLQPFLHGSVYKKNRRDS